MRWLLISGYPKFIACKSCLAYIFVSLYILVYVHAIVWWLNSKTVPGFRVGATFKIIFQDLEFFFPVIIWWHVGFCVDWMGSWVCKCLFELPRQTPKQKTPILNVYSISSFKELIILIYLFFFCYLNSRTPWDSSTSLLSFLLPFILVRNS